MGRPHYTTNADGLRPSYPHLLRGETCALTRALMGMITVGTTVNHS